MSAVYKLPPFGHLKIFLLEYSYFTMLCQLLLYDKVNQLSVYIYPLFFGFPSHSGHHRALRRVPWATQRSSLVISFIHSINSVYVSVLISQLIPPPRLLQDREPLPCSAMEKPQESWGWQGWSGGWGQWWSRIQLRFSMIYQPGWPLCGHWPFSFWDVSWIPSLQWAGDQPAPCPTSVVSIAHKVYVELTTVWFA